MVERSVVTTVRNYLAALAEAGIEVEQAVVFGSQAKGRANEWSDIDLLVVGAMFDGIKDRSVVNRLWHLAAQVDSRIEPIPCGARQWREDDASAIIEIARREGEVIKAA
jgi:predicted nucleotidyltransferase